MKTNTDPYWLAQFRQRMAAFDDADHGGHVACSVKVRVESGCFHREHSPEAYKAIDAYLDQSSTSVHFEEHESGPEILVYLAVTTAGLALAKSVVELVTAIVKARSDGIKKGDRPRDPLELIVRRIDKDGRYAEERILRIPPEFDVDSAKISAELLKHSIEVRDDAAPKTKKRKRG